MPLAERGFQITRDPELLVRAAGSWAPRAFRAWLVGRLRGPASSRRRRSTGEFERERPGTDRAP
ncbi:MAG: hypothetical protein AUG00_00880 [Candidatus Rokubacteria bacterium 13_1_20CM_2_70_7]|nr:MAG: hypothetical protein AUG00_00880 [Candidatus Rokubacteria bacterium 13_1_20CM_2_70_7]